MGRNGMKFLKDYILNLSLHTHTQNMLYVFSVFPRQQYLRERVSLLLL